MKKTFYELHQKQLQFEADPVKIRFMQMYRRRHLVLKEYHLAAIRKERLK